MTTTNTTTIASRLADIADNEAITAGAVARDAQLCTANDLPANIDAATISRANHIMHQRTLDMIARYNGTNDAKPVEQEEITKPARRQHTQKRGKIFGFSVTAVLRWMGTKDWSFEDAAVCLADYGLGSISDVTIRLQLKAGRDGKRGAPANISPSQARQLKASTI